MFIYQLSISIPDNKILPEAFEQFEFLLASYRSNGQTLGAENTCYIKDGSLIAVVHTHEQSSLNKEQNNLYVNLRIENLEALCGTVLAINLLGDIAEEASVCTCATSDFYFLITEHNSIHSPIKCGTCFEVVPLYKLPPYYEHGYTQVVAWQTNYQACDVLQQNGEVGEEWAIGQMENPNSELSINGRSIAAGIEQQSGIDTYYYLHNSKETTVTEELDSVCPACQQEWLLMQPLAGGIFPFKCDNCRLISTFSSNIIA